MAERASRRIQRHLEEARLPPGKTLDSFDFEAVPMISKAQVMALAAGDSWLEKGANLLDVRPAGRRASRTWRPPWAWPWSRTAGGCCSPAPPIWCRSCRAARRDLQLEAAIAKLDKYHLLILDDLAYVSKDQAETSVIFELIGARYERRSLLITANQPFGEWGRIFPDQAMTLAAVDRLVHHATIFEMNVESYRRRSRHRAQTRTRTPADARDNQHLILIDARSDNQESACISCRGATIIIPPRQQITILIAALLQSRLSRNSWSTTTSCTDEQGSSRDWRSTVSRTLEQTEPSTSSP